MGTISIASANRRDMLLFGETYDEKKYFGGVRRFDSLDVQTASKLLNNGFVDPDENQNGSPTASEIIDFCLEYPDNWTIHGYAVSPKRDDCRVTFEGVASNAELSIEEITDFVTLFRFADEFSIGDNGAWCWYD